MKSVSEKKVLENFVFQFLYQFIILIIPLVISPFLTRVMGSNSLGIYSYVYSIVYYFIVLANLGISRYGQRLISTRTNDDDLRKSFWSLYTLHAIISLISIITYFTFVTFFVKENKSVFYIEGFFVLSALFDITWLYYGLQNFKSVVIKNLIIKIIELILIFTLIKSPNDLFIYALIVSVSMAISQFILIPQTIFIIKPIKFSFQDAKKHMIPLLIFSINVIAVTLYTIFDKTLIGIIVNKESVAYYEYASKIVVIPTTIIGIIGTVMFPKACQLANEGDIDGQKKYLKVSLLFTFFIGFAVLFGFIALGVPFAKFYYGDEFLESGKAIMAMAPLPLIVGFGDIIRTQYLIPNKHDKEYTICLILNAIINLTLSIILLHQIGFYGAIVGTICAELFGCIFQIIICRKYISIIECLKLLIPFLIIGLIMYGVIYFSSYIINDDLTGFIIKFACGFIAYCLLTIIYMFVFQKNILKTLFNIFFKKRLDK